MARMGKFSDAFTHNIKLELKKKSSLLLSRIFWLTSRKGYLIFRMEKAHPTTPKKPSVILSSSDVVKTLMVETKTETWKKIESKTRD